MSLPRFSVITPSFNQGEFIRDTIDSVLAQNYPNFEHIIIDGGSTDDTVSILKSYPHLKWISEKDRGQTHALNKGLKLATGDIIAWINSDDWYPKDIFNLISQSIITHPIIMGMCSITNRNGEVDYTVPNVERNWFDVLKYWCSYSIPTQPSIFFRRDILNKVILSNGDYLDEDLDLCMDYELWLRLFKVAPPFRIPQVLAFYRMYETNKTGGGLEPHLPEMSRIFRKHSITKIEQESSFSVIVPWLTDGLQAFATIDSLHVARGGDFEILICPTGVNLPKSQEIRNSLNLKYPRLTKRFRITKPISDLNKTTKISSSCKGGITIFTDYGTIINSDTFSELQKIFEDDEVGVVINGNDELSKEAVFSSIPKQFCLAIRTITLQELLQNDIGDNILDSYRTICLRAMFLGWKIKNTAITRNTSIHSEIEKSYDSFSRISAKLITKLDTELNNTPFAQVRASHGYSIAFDQNTVNEAKKILEG